MAKKKEPHRPTDDGRLPGQAKDGDTHETLNALQEWVYEEWDGLTAYFQDPDLEEETAVELTVVKVETGN
ncbi:hypothetical protein ACFQ7M_39510 [Streptomyces massasporeus]